MPHTRPSRSPTGWKRWACTPACSATPCTCDIPCRSTQCEPEARRRRDTGADRVGVIGFSAGGHLAGLAALAPSSDARESPDFVVLGYAITSMETETYRPSRIILLGEDATPQLRRETSLDALVTPSSPPFFIWHNAEDIYVPPEHTYRLAAALAANDIAHAVHVFSHGPHSLGLAHGAGDVAIWTTLAASWIAEQADLPARSRTPGDLDPREART